jgi:hypothetical protein
MLVVLAAGAANANQGGFSGGPHFVPHARPGIARHAFLHHPFFFRPVFFVAPIYYPVAPVPYWSNCYQYQTMMVIGGLLQPGYATACLGPDGLWYNVD